MEIYNTYMLGAGKLVDCEFVLVYSTDSFKRRADELYLDNSSISSSDLLPTLSSLPDKNTISSIVRTILRVKDKSGVLVYNVSEVNKVTDPGSKYYSEFIVSNRKDNIVGPDGFNVLVYLCNDGNIGLTPIGFSTFLEPQGSSVFTESDKYMIRKSYYVKNLHIYIGFDNQLLFNSDNVNLLDNLYETANPKKINLVGDDDWKYVSVEKIKKRKSNNTVRPLYSSRLYSCDLEKARSQYIYSDCGSFELGKNSEILNRTKLCITKNIHIDRYNNAFSNYQVGFYKGDPALFVWSNENNYSIYSLAKKNKVGNIVMYTNPINSGNLIFSSSVYRLPSYDNGFDSKIEYFSGNLIQTLHTNTETGESKRVVFNIDLQNTIDNKDNSGWMNYGDYNALLDPLDIKNRVILSRKLVFPNKIEAISSIPELTDTYFDLSRYSNEYSINIEGKRGEWFIIGHPSIGIKILTNMTKTVIIKSSELGNVIFVNNQVLIVKSPNLNKPSEITYTLFDEDGDFMTEGADEYLRTYYNSLNLADKYAVPGITKRLLIDNSANSTNSILDIQRSFFSYFRRNILPISLTDFEIVGGLYGLIFYRFGSYINYL